MRAVQRDRHGLGVDRRPFIPATIWRYRDDGWMVPVHRGVEPERWAAMVDADDSVVTQVDDGTPRGGDKGMRPTCSSSAPWLMRRMLDALGVEPGMKVLEIGAGMGYNAACLAEAGAHVVTVEIDPELASHARYVLEEQGYADWVTVITCDGEDGVPQHAPYDRVIATAAMHTVPYAWVEQTRDGGRIVVPYTGPVALGALLTLTVRDGAAEGCAVGEAAFMPMRGQRIQQNGLPIYGEDVASLSVRVDRDGTHVGT